MNPFNTFFIVESISKFGEDDIQALVQTTHISLTAIQN